MTFVCKGSNLKGGYMATWLDVNYKCGHCGATDTDRVMSGRTPSPVANCWKCGSGRGQDIPEMLERGTGMRIVSDEPSHRARVAG